MKTISMEFSEYKEDLSKEFQKGYQEGSKEVFKLLESVLSEEDIEELKERFKTESEA